jgi:hypothetical protein
MRLAVLVSLFLAAACAAATYEVHPITLAAMDGPAMRCYVHQVDGTEIMDARLIRVGDLWAVTGDVRGSLPARAERQRVKIEAVAADESLVLGTLSPTTNGGHRSWTFHLPIPDPATFDHLHLAVVSSNEALRTLPPHQPTYY